MRIIAAIRADLEQSDIGTRSRLGDELVGVPILRRTVERAARTAGIAATYVLCPTGQRGRCENILAGTTARILEFHEDPSPWRTLAQTARKWSLEGWRGGLGGATYFDEFVDVPLLHGLVRREPAHAVLSLSAAAPLFSAELAGRMVAHLEAHAEEVRLVFTTAVPGLSGLLLQASLIDELLEKNLPVGTLFSYKPDAPRKDLVFQGCCLDLPAPLRFATGRLVADTDRAMTRVHELIRDGHDSILAAIGAWLVDRDAAYVEPFPREIELELTTDDPYPDTILRPRGLAVGGRGPIPLDLVRAVTAELNDYDDALLVLGGFGDPLRHPQLPEILNILRPPGQRGVFGIAVRTTGVDLTPPLIRSLIDHRVDVLSVLIDAWSPETYARLHAKGDLSAACLDRVTGRLANVADARRAASAVAPIVVPEFCKTRDNVEELDAFHDGWIRRVGSASIVGYSNHSGQRPGRAVIDLRPPVRTPCRRIRSRCLILADGTMTLCDQDFAGASGVERLGQRSLRELWQSALLDRARDSHRRGDWDEFAICGACQEWHRP
jgi:hypothetical protein